MFSVTLLTIFAAALTAPATAPTPDVPSHVQRVCSSTLIYAADTLPGGLVAVTLRGSKLPADRIATVRLRLDDPNGHWLYPALDTPRAKLILPANPAAPLNLTVASIVLVTGEQAECTPRVFSIAAEKRGSQATAVGPVLQPGPRIPDPPAVCRTPFASASTLKAAIPQAPPMTAWTRVRGVVTVIVSVAADGSVTDARIASSPSTYVNAAALESARHSTFQPDLSLQPRQR